MRQALVALLLLAALLAGCADGGKDPPTDTPAAFDEVQVDEDTGAIRGVVVDEAIVPIAGVLIQLNTGQNKTSDAEGAFVFNGLTPGEYFLTAKKVGYLDSQASASVVANDPDPPVTKVSLRLDANALKPYYQEYTYDGYITCSVTAVAVAFAACSFVNTFGPIVDDRFGVTYPLDRKPDWIQTEMHWDSTQTAGGEMSLQYSWDCGSENGGFLCDYGVAGPSPLVLVANATAIAEINEGDYNGTELFVRSFNEGLAETDPDIPGYGSAPGGGLGLTLNQRFVYYTHIFYGYTPPEGWLFSDGAGVPLPPA